MIVWAIRAAFILVIFGIGYGSVMSGARPLGDSTWLVLALSLVAGVGVILVDYLAPRRKLTIFAGTFFGLLVGIVLAYALSFVLSPLADRYVSANPEYFPLPSDAQSFRESVNLFIGAITCYLAISFVLQTKDDFRFIVPYVEFSKQTKGSRPVILDTSALIDGRVADIAAAGIFDTQLIVPRFVLNELQQVADSTEKRSRGRRGLDVLKKLQEIKKLDIVIQEASHLDARKAGVDQLIMALAAELNARVLTTDFNLNKVAQVSGVDVINVNDLANALKSELLPGETMTVRIVKPGAESNQGVGYLDDGTMVVVGHGKSYIGQDVQFVVTNTRQTSAGKMIFGRLADDHGPPLGEDEPRPSPEPKPEPAHVGGDGRHEPQRRGGNGGSGVSRSPRRGPEHRGPEARK